MVNVVWSECPLASDNRARYATNTLLNLAMDHAEVGLVHRNGFENLPPDAKGAIVVIHGEHQVGIARELISRVRQLQWSLSIVTGDECSLFPSWELVGANRKVWQQYPVPGQHDFADRRLTAGYPHDCPNHLDLLRSQFSATGVGGYGVFDTDRIYDFSYVGQVNHAGRRACVNVLKTMLNGYVYETPGFWQGLDRAEYYRILTRTKVVACPAGGAIPESLRIGEGIEAGCMVVVDDRWPPGFPRLGRPGMNGYWRHVLQEEPPFPVIQDWRAFPEVLEDVLRGWPANRDRLREWWGGYKRRWAKWLEDDLRALGALG